MARSLYCLFVVALLGASVACKKDDSVNNQVDDNDDPTLLAEDGTDSSAVETDAEVLTGTLIASSTSSAGMLTDGAKTTFLPKGCVTVTSDTAAKSIAYVFDGCRGPDGLLKISGEVDATYSFSAGTLSLVVDGKGLTVNRATVDYHATTDITTDDAGTSRTMTWKASLAGVTARGRDFARTDQKTVTWMIGGTCFETDGTSTGTVKDRSVTTEIAGYKRCGALACPAAGGSITISNDKKVKVEIEFDGTDNATFTTPQGTSTIQLACSG